jgi:folylpolyglutamate synthase/dihydropteroate synthase
MNVRDILDHKARLSARLEAIEAEKAQIARKLKAIEVLLEGEFPHVQEAVEDEAKEVVEPGLAAQGRRHASHAVRISDRISLIDAVKEVAMRMPRTFDSGQVLIEVNQAYPEFNLTETKHISSQLSDLVKRGVLVVVSPRVGKSPNIYGVAQKASL